MIEVRLQIRDELHLDEEEGANIVDSDGTLQVISRRISFQNKD
jgi:hypothetical protein